MKLRRKTVAGIILILLLIGMPNLAFNINLAKASSPTVHNIDTGKSYATIHEAIDADETLDGHTILVDSGIYYENVQVTKSINLVGEDPLTTIIDGRGDLNARAVLSIYGDPFHPLKNVTISGFTIKNGSQGIVIGMMWDPQTDSWGMANITNNIVRNNIVGISVNGGRNNILKDNDMSSNTFNFDLHASGVHDIDITNTVNGKPVRYFVNQSGLLIDPTTFPNIGYLALVNCTNVAVRNLVLSENGQGVLIMESHNITLLNNEILNNCYGVDASTVNESQFAGNTIYNNGLGLMLKVGRSNSITNNDFENNTALNVPSEVHDLRLRLEEGFGGDSGALSLMGVTLSTIVGNTMANNDEGIDLSRCSGNTLRNNNLTANTLNFGIHAYLTKSSYFANDIDTSNTVNGKPIIWWIGQHNRHVPSDVGYVVIINSTNISIKNLEVNQNRQGILIVSSNNTVISGNIISNVAYGVAIYQSYKDIPGPIFNSINNTVVNNTVMDSGAGILIQSGWNHTISFNSLSRNLAGVVVKGGASATMIISNIVTSSTYPGPHNLPHESWQREIMAYGSTGVIIESSSNLVSGNTISYSDIGIAVGLMTLHGNNMIYHNNFVGNTNQSLSSSFNTWDGGYPSGGNYWDDYSELDIDGDGIGDTPYVIDANNQDRYPLVVPLGLIPVVLDETIYPLELKSNSTISRFQSNASQMKISFNVTGPDGTRGFCNLTIPNSLVEDLWQSNYRVLVDEEEPITINDWTDGTYTYIYFTYVHSTHEVTIIQGLPPQPPFWMQWWFWTIIAAVFVAVAGAVYFLKKRRRSVTPPLPPEGTDAPRTRDAKVSPP